MRAFRWSARRLCVRSNHYQWSGAAAPRMVMRKFHQTTSRLAVKPFILADIGEGIKEVQIIQWFVQPGARVEQFDKLCEVASDKAIVEITSRFDGIVKELYYQPEDMAQVGKPLCDIDVQGDRTLDAIPQISTIHETPGTSDPRPEKHAPKSEKMDRSNTGFVLSEEKPKEHSAVATPAVRGLLKEHSLQIEDIRGSGKDGRVLKEDVYRFIEERASETKSSGRQERLAADNEEQATSTVNLTPIQLAMFKSMTSSLSIPQFLYADEVDFTQLASIRKRLNADTHANFKFSYLPFVVKAVSLALEDYPLLNSRLEIPKDGPPKIIMRSKHNIGVAMDTPHGLVVPNIKNVASLSIKEIARQIAHLHSLAKASKLTTAHLTGGTVTVSNIGNIGGTYVAPVVIPGEVAILGMGRIRDVPSFDHKEIVVRKTIGNLSWSADHRVIDGATMARMGERLKHVLEYPSNMLVVMR